MRKGELEELSEGIEIGLLSDDIPFEWRGAHCHKHLVTLHEGKESTVLLLLRLNQLYSQCFDVLVED
jgi:hypothetical protein